MYIECWVNTGSNSSWWGGVREGFPEEVVLELRQTSHPRGMWGLWDGVGEAEDKPGAFLEH